MSKLSPVRCTFDEFVVYVWLMYQDCCTLVLTQNDLVAGKLAVALNWSGFYQNQINKWS